MTWWSALMAKKSSPCNLQQEKQNKTLTQMRKIKDNNEGVNLREHSKKDIFKCMHIIYSEAVNAIPREHIRHYGNQT